jgi:hypothetical protein
MVRRGEVGVGRTNFLSHSCGGKSGFAASLAESLRLSVNPFLFGRGYASLFCSNSFSQIPKLLLLALAFLVVGISPGCSQSSPNSPAGNSATTQPTTSPVPLTGFERDLQFIRSGQFAHVWVFSRKDGKPLDKDDAAYLRANAPQVVDWVTTDDKKRVIAGTNFDLEQGNMPQLRLRFVAEDYTGK